MSRLPPDRAKIREYMLKRAIEMAENRIEIEKQGLGDQVTQVSAIEFPTKEHGEIADSLWPEVQAEAVEIVKRNLALQTQNPELN